MSDSQNHEPQAPLDDDVRHHIYDGIQEYDKRLPNWWLFTLYGAIIFSAAYWFYWHQSGEKQSAFERVKQEMNELALRAANSGKPLTDEQLWEMSRNPEIVAEGKAIFMSTCASCHGEDLKGGIGFNLVDSEWVHGGKPTQVIHTVINGVQEKGMPEWGPVLGRARVAQAVAYVLSHHSPSEVEASGEDAGSQQPEASQGSEVQPAQEG